MPVRLGPIGVWRPGALLTPDLAMTLERLGYSTIWIGGSPDAALRIVDELLDATETITIGTGVVNMWKDEAAPVAASFHRIESAHPGRFLLGVGIGHPEATSDYAHPYETAVRYLDGLDDAQVPRERVVLAALGPRMLRLAADRTAGAHPYLTTPEHTRRARDIMGPGALLVPEQKVVLDSDPERARALARKVLVNTYFRLVNYTSMLRSIGFTDDDLAGEASDRLIDAVANHGDVRAVADEASGHLDAGADQVAIQLLTGRDEDPVPGFTALAEALIR